MPGAARQPADRGHARSGRRDPEVAARIQRGRANPPTPEPDPADLIGPGVLPDEALLGTEPDPEEDTVTTNEQSDYDPTGQPLWPGDRITAKVGRSFTVNGENVWASWEAESTVRADEEELDAFERVGAEVNQRVMDLSADLEERILADDAERAERRRTSRIQPRG